MNLLPLPALDGGRIVMALPEILFRRRVPMKYENAIHLVGFALLLLLLIYINVQDFIIRSNCHDCCRIRFPGMPPTAISLFSSFLKPCWILKNRFPRAFCTVFRTWTQMKLKN